MQSEEVLLMNTATTIWLGIMAVIAVVFVVIKLKNR